MKIPSLRRPVGASVLAGICGAGLLDLLLTAGHGGATGVLALTLGFYGTAAIVCGLGAVLVVEIVAALGQRMFVGKMASQKLATIAAAGLVAIGALPGAAVAIAA